MGDLFDDWIGCPTCAETRMVRLDWYDPGTGPFPRYPYEYVWCRQCGTAYDPNHDSLVVDNTQHGMS